MGKKRTQELIDKVDAFYFKRNEILGKLTEFEYVLRCIDDVFDYVNGIRQAANISNNSLSDKAKGAQAKLQELSSLIKAMRQLRNDLELVADRLPEVPEDQPQPQPTVDGVS